MSDTFFYGGSALDLVDPALLLHRRDCGNGVHAGELDGLGASRESGVESWESRVRSRENRTAPGALWLLPRVRGGLHQRFAAHDRSKPAASLLAHADREPHRAADVQGVGADVAGLVGA